MTNPTLPVLRLALALVSAHHVPGYVVAAAQQETAAVFRRVGVEIEWTVDAARRDAIPVTVWAHDSRVMRAFDRRVLGAVVAGGNGRESAWLFFERIERDTEPYGVDPALVLGDAIAHEVGHLLLPRGTHGERGLMRAAWRKDDMYLAARGQLGFTREEATVVRAQVAARPGGASVEQQRAARVDPGTGARNTLDGVKPTVGR
jgi:hypothetical protein